MSRSSSILSRSRRSASRRSSPPDRCAAPLPGTSPRTTGRSRSRPPTTEMAAFLEDRRREGSGRASRSRGRRRRGARSTSSTRRTGATPAFRILFYAQQHGDEISGKDALLYLDPRHRARPVAPPAGRRPLDDADDEPRRRRGGDAEERRRGGPEPRPRDPRPARDAGAPPRRAAGAAAPRRRRARVRARLGGVDEEGLGEVARHHDGRAEQPALRRRADRGGAALGRRGGRRRGRRPGTASSATGSAARRPTTSSATRRPTPTAASTASARTAASRSSSRPRSATSAKDPSADLGNRVDAYLVLFRRFLDGDGHRAGDLAVVERARKLPLPAFLPSDALWVNPGGDGDRVPRRRDRDGSGREGPDREPDDRGGGEADRADAARLRGRPGGGRGDRRAARPARHPVRDARRAADGRRPRRCTLLRVEEEFDDVYSRYGGRTIVTRGRPRATELAAGSLWVPLEGEAAAAGRDPPRADRDVRPLAVPAVPGARRRRTGRSRSAASSAWPAR